MSSEAYKPDSASGGWGKTKGVLKVALILPETW